MRARTLLSATLLGALLLSTASTAGAWTRPRAAAPHPAGAGGELIVGFRELSSRGDRAAAVAAAGAVAVRDFGAIGAVLVRTPGDPKVVQRVLERRGEVRYIEANSRLYADDHGSYPSDPNDPAFHNLWGVHNFGQQVNGITGQADADIDAREAWQVSTGSASVGIGVIDTGIDFGHPDLGGSATTSPRIWVNAGENCGSSDAAIACGSRTNGVDDDRNGYVDDWRGWDFVNRDNDPSDDNGHGTHVAGTIGASGNNGVGVAGVTWNVRFLNLKAFNQNGQGTTADAVEAILYATAQGIRITNNSWGDRGSGTYSQALFDAIANADGHGALFVAAAGNNAADNDQTPFYPSGYDLPNVVAVAATDSSDNRASFSNWGQRTVDLGAPGANVYSTWPGNTYKYLNGTSMATPHVSGSAALLSAALPGVGHLGLKALILRSVDPITALASRTVSGGRLNVDTAIRCRSTPRVWIDAPGPDFTAAVGSPIAIRVIAADCASPTGPSVSVTANGTALALTPRGDGLYTASHTPTAPGSLTFEATASLTTPTGSLADVRSVTGTVVTNYRVEDAAYEWIDATSGGTKTSLASDDTSVTLSLPFPVTYYGASYSQVKVSSNGYLVFAASDATAFANAAIPDASPPNGYIAPFWDDLNPGSGGSVWYRVTGTSPSRTFVVAWIGVPHYPNVGSATFEVVLEEATGDVVFQYQDVVFGSASYDHGASATIGVEHRDGTLGRHFSYNQATLATYQGQKGVRFTTTAAGPSITTSSLADGTTGQVYSQTLSASGGSEPYAWSLKSGTLPPGLTLAPAGTISGTPSQVGSWAFDVSVTDGSQPPQSASKSLSIRVDGPLVIATSSLADGTTGQAYSQPLSASGGRTPYAWSLTAGSLPPGLALAPAGTISGTPSQAGTWSFTLTATDSGNPLRTASKPLSITIVDPPPSPITLSAKGYKVKGLQRVDLTWTPTAAGSVNVYRGGTFLVESAHDGAYTDRINVKGGGTYTYRICLPGGGCSNEVTVTF